MGNTGSCSGGRGHPHTPLIQFSAEGSGCAQLFDLRWPSPGVDRLYGRAKVANTKMFLLLWMLQYGSKYLLF